LSSKSQVDGAAIYSPAVLAIYDAWVLGVSNRWLWQCSTPRLLAHYNRHVSGNHLDVGVGTGYYLHRCRFPIARPRVALLDVNPHALRTAARRIARYQPEVYERDVCEPLNLDVPPFDSIGLIYVLHCLAGTMAEKARVFANLRPLLRPGGVLFGATLLGRPLPCSAAGRWLLRRYNASGIFSNTDDDADSLRAALCKHFEHITLETHGCAALFSATSSPLVPRKATLDSEFD
jgi:SAM-dependent methyltransferase